ncbi:MAG: hypothetical protein HY521_10290 [Proteobacteria bacterium]|nr:hypothetical protein [Pseudomonadota bacterium]
MKRWVAAGLAVLVATAINLVVLLVLTSEPPERRPRPLPPDACPGWPFPDSTAAGYIAEHGGLPRARRTMELMRIVARATLGRSEKQDQALAVLGCYAEERALPRRP